MATSSGPARSTLLLGLLLVASPVLAGAQQPGDSDSQESVESAAGTLLDRQIELEAAKQALEAGEKDLALSLLEALAAAAGDGPEGLLYRALAATAADEEESAAELLGEAQAALAADAASTPAWVRREIIRVAAERRLTDLRGARRALEEASERALHEILERHMEARGGLERWQALRSLVVSGRAVLDGRELPFKLHRMRPSFYRFDLVTPGGVLTEVADGQAAWRSAPSSEEGRASYVDGPERARLLRAAPFDDVLVPFAASRPAVRLAGEETAGEDRIHRLEVTYADGWLQTVYLSVRTHLVARRTFRDPSGDVTAEVETSYAETGGFMMPSREAVTTGSGTVVYLYDDYRFDPPLATHGFDIDSHPSRRPAAEEDLGSGAAEETRRARPGSDG